MKLVTTGTIFIGCTATTPVHNIHGKNFDDYSCTLQTTAYTVKYPKMTNSSAYQNFD